MGLPFDRVPIGAGARVLLILLLTREDFLPLALNDDINQQNAANRS